MTTARSYLPQPPGPLRLSHRGFAVLAVLYGMVTVYSSLLLGPDGLHYVPISAAEAWQKFRAVTFVVNGSDQRPDWIANMMMTIPLAYFVNGAFRLRGGSRNLVNAGLAAAISIAFVLAVKYAQLFFPPRTVTLNYIAAQSIGVVLGIVLFHVARRHIYRRLLDTYRRGDGLVIVLGGYSILLMAYFLMPFDLALSPDDLLIRLESLLIAVIPGAGHDPVYRALLVLLDMAATVPAGMFLAVTGRDMPFRAQLARGMAVILPMTVASLFVLSITPYLIFLLSRTAGVVLGLWFMEALKGKDLWKRHYRYAQYVPVAFP
ncbi:MAG TPA: VanZ family protein, partial [Alphaproteobacteria bacterium]|nr:VanZ family protein [Alphaproteobacteria bacterium]